VCEDKIVQVAAGENHNLYLSEEGKVYTNGNNIHGQLGSGDEEIKNETTFVLL